MKQKELTKTFDFKLKNNFGTSVLDPLSPHDALKHHCTSLKTDLIFLQLGVLE